MEEVYIIRIKTKPLLSSLYPSERRYSASTVGGLAMVHFGLGVLALLLGSLAGLIQGPILALFCLIPFISGLLAWKKWYIDRNIGLFFYGSLISLIVALFCLAATIFHMITILQGNDTSSWSMEHIFNFDSSNGSLNAFAKHNNSSFNDELSIDRINFNDKILNDNSSDDEDDFNLPFRRIDTLDDLVAESSMIEEKRIFGNNVVNKSGLPEMMKVGENEDGLLHSKLLLATNVLVASLLEVAWSFLSARIGLRGMINRVETIYGGGGNVTIGNNKKQKIGCKKKKMQAPRPDILSHYQKNFGSLQSLNSFQSSINSGPRLPLPESSREFRERVERFLVNQAASQNC